MKTLFIFDEKVSPILQFCVGLTLKLERGWQVCGLEIVVSDTAHARARAIFLQRASLYRVLKVDLSFDSSIMLCLATCVTKEEYLNRVCIVVVMRLRYFKACLALFLVD